MSRQPGVTRRSITGSPSSSARTRCRRAGPTSNRSTHVALSPGRSFRRPEDLLALARLVRQLCHGSVSETMPAV